MLTEGPGILVTGASRGLGLGMVRGLLARGYRVAACSRHKTAALAELEAAYAATGFRWFACEVGDEGRETALFDHLRTWLDGDPLFGLINNAAAAGEGVLATFPNVESERILQVNLLGSLRLSRLAVRWMLQSNTPGRIVNISSITGGRGYTGLTAYSASKAGLDGLTRSLAREVGRRGITVNSVAPGYFETELSASLDERQRERIRSRTPMGRLARIEDLVPVVAFLLSDDAAFITGQTIVVDGGLTC